MTGSQAADGHVLQNCIPLSIFPIAPDKFCFCFCGLPGRGKTHISRRLAQYLSFFHAVPVKVFNVAEYRKRMCGGLKDAEWFDYNNAEAWALRDSCNKAAIRDMVSFLDEHCNGIVILDSTNPTHERRLYLKNTMHKCGAKVMFIEVHNDDEAFLASNYRTTVSTSIDYVGVADNDSEIDYRKKVEKYKCMFEPLNSSSPVEASWPFMRCDHAKQHFV
eukprot:gene40363-49189_t